MADRMARAYRKLPSLAVETLACLTGARAQAQAIRPDERPHKHHSAFRGADVNFPFGSSSIYLIAGNTAVTHEQKHNTAVPVHGASPSPDEQADPVGSVVRTRSDSGELVASTCLS